MNCLQYILPCCFRNNNYSNNENVNSNEIDILKLKNINEISSKGKKKSFKYEGKIIQKLEMDNSCHYAKVIDIYDADTITCILFFRNIPNIVKIRLHGIDAPEMKPDKLNENDMIKEKALAIISKVVLQKLIQKNNNIIFLKTYGSEKYGRTLANIYKEENGSESFNEILINLKLVDKYDGKKKEKNFKSQYLNLRDSNGIINFYENKDNSFDELFTFINNIYPLNRVR